MYRMYQLNMKISGTSMADGAIDSVTIRELYQAAGAEFAQTLFAQIRADFARLHDALLGQMMSFSDTGGPEFEVIRKTAHELKGLALTVGANRLADACANAEGLAQKKDATRLSESVSGMISLCAQVRIELARSFAGAE